MFLDANLPIYLNVILDRGRREIYENFYIDLLRSHAIYTDALMSDEVIFISRRRYGVPYEVTLEFIESVVLPYVAIHKVREGGI